MIPKIIVITGIDGSGKTTQANMLYNYCLNKKINAESTQQFNIDSTIGSKLLSRIGPNLIKLERSVSNQSLFHSNEPKSFLKSTLKKIAEFRIIFMGIYNTWYKIFKYRKSDIVIFDRYFYDDIIKTKWLYGTSDRIGQFVVKLVPKPTVLFYLDVKIEIAWEREEGGNTTLMQHEKKKEIYEEWFNEICGYNDNHYKMPADLNITQIHTQILNKLKRNNKINGC